MKTINWKYAFGEILIVIIGITIAFTMNKCAENNKEDKLRQQYLVNIRNDVEADKASLEKNAEEIGEKIKKAEKILPVLNSESDQKMEIVRDIFDVAVISNFNSRDITYQTLINSGDLKLINDFELKTAIQGHYSSYSVLRKEYERQEIIHKDFLGKYFIENGDFDAFPKGKFGFTNEKLLKNIIQSMRGSFFIKLNATNAAIESCDSLLSVLKTHIRE